MNNSKLVNVLRTFSKSEMKDFEKLVSSPFFNKGRNYLPFLKELKRFYPDFDDVKMTDEYIFSKMYPHKKFNKQIIWNMTSALLNMSEEFLLLSSLKKNRFIKNHQIANELHHKKLSQHFLKKIEEMEHELNHMRLNRDYFLFKKQLELSRKEYYYLEDKQRMMPPHTIKQGEYAILFFLWNIVEVVNDIRVNSYMYNTTFDLNVIHEFLKNLQLSNVIDYCKGKKFGYAWLLEMHYNQIMMTMEPDNSKYFFSLKKLFEHNYEKFAGEEKLNWMTCLINWCGYRRDENSRKILFELHKFELKEGIAFIGKYLTKTHYLQILKNALAINETVWAEHFIEQFVPKLKPANQKPMRAFGFALLYLKLKDYEKVFESLTGDKIPDPKDKLQVKIIYIRSYYELNEIQTLLYHIDSTLHFISNNQRLIPKEIASNYNKCLKFAKQLITAKENNNYAKIDEIHKELEKNRNLILSEWLMEKIEELK